MVGKVSHLEGLRRTPPDEDDRRADAGKPQVRFDEGVQETCEIAARLRPTLQDPPSRKIHLPIEKDLTKGRESTLSERAHLPKAIDEDLWQSRW